MNKIVACNYATLMSCDQYYRLNKRYGKGNLRRLQQICFLVLTGLIYSPSSIMNDIAMKIKNLHQLITSNHPYTLNINTKYRKHFIKSNLNIYTIEF